MSETVGSTILLDLEERVKIAVRVGESQYREYKSALHGPPSKRISRSARDIATDIARTLVGFANSDGGELLVGVEDDGGISGVSLSEDAISELMQVIRNGIHPDTPLPEPRLAKVVIDGKLILYFSVEKGVDFVHLTSDGRCLRRVDRQTVPVASETIRADRHEKVSRTWERQFEHSASITDLDLDLLEEVAVQIAYGVSPEKCLQYLDLAEFTNAGLRLKNAALLLFAKDIRRWHSRCQVRIIAVRGTEQRSGTHFNVGRDEVVADNVLRLIDKSWERLNLALTTSQSVSDSARFTHNLLYPQTACREALINAIAHRDYASTGIGIEITIFQDRMELVSPGGLLSTITLDDIRLLEGAHESRNPLLCRVLREVGVMREMGEGVRRIFDVMRSNALAEPLLDDDGRRFSVTLYSKSMYDPAVKLWLSTFDEYKLTESQRAVLALGFRGETFSTQQMIDRLGIVDTDQIREITTPLRQSGLLERTMDKSKLHRQAKQLRIPVREVPVFKVVSPKEFRPQEIGNVHEDQIDAASQSTAKLFIANISYQMSRTEIYEMLTEFGDVIALQVPGSQEEGSPHRGYSFATIASRHAPNELVALLDGQVLKGRKVHVSLAR